MRKGFTLLETVIALAILTVLSAGAFQAWRYTSQSAARLMGRTDALENARAAMDALKINLQLAQEITLVTGADGSLKSLDTLQWERNAKGTLALKHYVFTYAAGALPTAVNYQRLEFGGDNEFAMGISELKLTRNGSVINIRVTAACEPPLTFETALDMRHKVFK